MDKEPDVDIIDLDDTIKKEPQLEESDYGQRYDDKPRFINFQKKTLIIAGAAVLMIMIFVAFFSSGGIYLTKAEFNALIERVDRIEARLADREGKTQYHVVARGESLSLIAKKYGLTVGELCNLNKMTPAQPIHPGQKLLVSPVKRS